LINELLEKFRIVIERERLQIERLFFDFDQKQMGFLELADFNQMVLFLRIPTNKHQIKICFQAIDIQKKGFITLANFKAFLEEGMALSMKKTNNPNENPEFLKKKPFSGSEDPEFQRILEKIKENSQISFEITLKTLDFTARQPLNEKTLGKILMERGCVLPNIELLQIIRKLQK
jgi:Ca2+-binding EF-hand superfamily protein